MMRGTEQPVWLLEALAALLVLAGIIAGRALWIIIGFFVAAVILLSQKWARRTYAALIIDSIPQQITLEIGQEWLYSVSISNPLAIAAGWIRVRQEIPQGLVQDDGSHHVGAEFVLGEYQKARVVWPLKGVARGRWILGDTTLVQSDLWGWRETVQKRFLPTVVTVWPRRFDIDLPLWQAVRELGETKGWLWDEPDPSYYRGIRPYRYGEPLRDVHPFASARAGTLMVKEVERVRALSVDIICHPYTADVPWHGIDMQAVETCLSLAASAVQTAFDQGLACGLTISCALPGLGHGVSLEPTMAMAARAEYFTNLAWAVATPAVSTNVQGLLENLLRQERPAGLLLVVSPKWDEAVDLLLQRLSSQGHVIGWLSAGSSVQLPTVVDVHWAWTEGGVVHETRTSSGR
ncbi:hypothetical protein BXT84_01925 [Sulfobacillus thermotolerans]|uniref:DUF58 domain-containing protein n=1 Tax=Sulfobacillus thermotolerans TaxID=338644 RepID=A0ABM6RND5_9FIRM|nr:hypothetical protein BXT84_01925 [Sulfobacillus thermotolerans]